MPCLCLKHATIFEARAEFWGLNFAQILGVTFYITFGDQETIHFWGDISLLNFGGNFWINVGSKYILLIYPQNLYRKVAPTS